MTGRTARIARVTALATTALFVVAAAPADAKQKHAKPVKVIEVSAAATAGGSAMGAGDPVSAVATCPGKTRVVSGGYSTTSPSFSPPGVHWFDVSESQRTAANQWRVSGVEYFQAPATDTVTAYAYCQPLKAKVRTVTATVPLAAVNLATATVASCPTGTKLLSGGYVTLPATNTDGSYVSRSAPVGTTGWVGDATNINGASARTLTVFAYCALLGKVKSVSQSTSVIGPNSSVHTATTPSCPKRTTARAGGFATSAPVGGLMSTAVVYESKRLGGTWTSSATASGNTTSSTLVSSALCS